MLTDEEFYEQVVSLLSGKTAAHRTDVRADASAAVRETLMKLSENQSEPWLDAVVTTDIRGATCTSVQRIKLRAVCADVASGLDGYAVGENDIYYKCEVVCFSFAKLSLKDFRGVDIRPVRGDTNRWSHASRRFPKFTGPGSVWVLLGLKCAPLGETYDVQIRTVLPRDSAGMWRDRAEVRNQFEAKEWYW